MTQLVLSLTAIPPRFPFLSQTLQSLLDQKADVAAVNLYLPRRYRRFEWDPTQLPAVPAGVNIRLVDEDLGPATKVLPAVREYQGQDVAIVFGDDDKVYDRDWAQRFMDASRAHPGCCIVEEGGDVCDYSNHAFRGDRQPRSGRRPKDLAYRWVFRTNVTAGFGIVTEDFGPS